HRQDAGQKPRNAHLGVHDSRDGARQHPGEKGDDDGHDRRDPGYDKRRGDGRPQGEGPVHRQIGEVQHAKGQIDPQGQHAVGQPLLNRPAQGVPTQSRYILPARSRIAGPECATSWCPSKKSGRPFKAFHPKRPAESGAYSSMMRTALAMTESGIWTFMRRAAPMLSTTLCSCKYSMGISAGFSPLSTRTAMSAVCRPSW